jgi:CRP-like cAMP-binding protein
MPVDEPLLATNRLLASLPPDARAELAGRLTRRRYDFGEAVYRQGQVADHVAFPVDGVFSLVSFMADGRGAEVATIGNEGLVGLAVFLRPGRAQTHRAFAQVPGDALVVRAREFADAARTDQEVRALLLGYTQALITQIAQGSVCNRLHSLEQRCIRWLLQTHDRVRRDEFRLTQEFLGLMLGVGRQAVNRTARTLQTRDLIRYGRGTVTILDRPRLEESACECYGRVRREFDQLLDGSSRESRARRA